MTPPGVNASAILSIINERVRQQELWGQQNHPDSWWMVILMEEIGEVAREIYEEGLDYEVRLRDELAQVAAVAMQWIEAIDRRTT